jgi:alpha-tubulin suppressor-like RCC1 family protein
MVISFPAISAVANQVVAWGDPPNVPVAANQAVAISAGWGYSLAIAPDGSLIDWGNDPGTPPTGLNHLAAVAASHGHSLALTTDGTVSIWGDPGLSWAWGGTPDGLTNIVDISANGDVDGEQSLALKRDGTVVAWGNVTSVPNGLSNVMAIAAGGWHELALENDGTVVAWGDDSYGQTDLPDGLTNVIAIAAGDFHSLALKRDGTVSAWGWDGEGELDIPDGLTNVIAISAGTYDSLALKSDGTVVAWGATYPPIDSGEADVPAGLTNVVAISAGPGYSLARTIPLHFTSLIVTNQDSLLRFHTFYGQQYSVEFSPDLSPGSWTPLPAGSFSGNGCDLTVIDTNAVASSPVRFYRLKQ